MNTQLETLKKTDSLGMSLEESVLLFLCAALV